MSFKALVTRYKVSTIIISIILGLSLIAGGITAVILLTRQSNPPADAITTSSVYIYADGTTATSSDYDWRLTVTYSSSTSTTCDLQRVYRNSNSTATSIVIPDEVVVGGSSKSLRNITGTNTSIIDGSYSDGAFYNVRNYIEEITLPDNLEFIYRFTFYGCKFSTIYLGPNVRMLMGAFASCTNLTNIIVSEDNRIYTTIDGILFNKSGNTLSVFPAGKSGDYVVPDTVTSIASYAFYGCSKLTNLTLPNNIAQIYDYTFYNCYNLKSINIPESVTSIGEYAFYNCSSLESITIPESVTSIGEYAFYNCSSLESITIPEGVTDIEGAAFQNCYRLTEINYNAVDATLHEIREDNGMSTFENRIFSSAGRSSNGITVNIGNKVENIPNMLFNPSKHGLPETTSETPNITKLNFIETSICKTIGYWAFASLDSLTNVTIPASITTIGYSFINCTNLVNIEADSNNSYYSSQDGVLFNKSKTQLVQYPKGKIGNTYTIPSTVTSIGSYAFYNCDSLNDIIFPNNTRSIGSSSFYNCDGISEITLPEKLTSIGSSAFYNCVGIANIILPNSLTSLGSSAFAECENLSSIVIPDKISRIETSVFENCTSLTTVTLPENITTIKSSAFEGCSSLTSITIPTSVTSLEERVFYNCRALTEINFNATNMTDLTSRDNVFYRAGRDGDGITLNIGADVTKIPAYLFYCTSYTVYSPKITTVIFENNSNCTTIGNNAFYYSTSLTSITFPDKINSIGNYAFRYCTRLTSVYFENYLDNDSDIGTSAFTNGSSSATYYFYRYNTYNLALNNTSKFSSDNFVFLGEAYTITVNTTTGGTVSGGGTYDSADTITLTATANSGYRFVNWTDSSGTVLSTSSTYNHTVTKDETITANFTANTYTITYNYNNATGGNTTTSKTVTYNSTYGTLPSPTRTGYTFGGWYKESTFSTPVTSASTVTTAGNHTLYAKWTANTYTITLNKQSGSGGTSSVTVTYDSPMPSASRPSRTGYSFQGYYTGTNGSGTRYYTNTMASARNWAETDVDTLYAYWRANTYYVSYNSNKPSNASHNVSGTMSRSTFTYGTYSNLRTNTYALTGWTFQGWATSSSATSATYTNGQRVRNLTSTNGGTRTLYAVWRANTYAIQLDQQNGTGGTSSVTATYDSSMPSATAPTRSGYEFLGYYTGTNGTGTQYYDANMNSVRNWTTTSGGTLYAAWNALNYTVIMESSGYPSKLGGLVGGFENTGWNGTYGTEHVRSGDYALKITGVAGSSETTITTTATIPFDSDTQNHIYYVQYWGYQEEQTTNGNTQIYWPIEEPPFGNRNPVNIALGPAGQWNMYSFYGDRSQNHTTAGMQFRVDYDNNGTAGVLWVDDIILLDLTEIFGAGNEPSKEWCDANIISGTNVQTVQYNTNTNLENRPGSTPEAYNFAGWSTSPKTTSSTNQNVSYANGASINNITSAGSTIILYGVWQIKSYTITVQSNNTNFGTVSGGGTYNHGATATLTATANEGYYFSHWQDSTGANVSQSPSFQVTVTSSTTYTAIFERITYTLNIYLSNESYGTVSGGGTYDYHQSVTVSANPNTGYTVDYWLVNNTRVPAMSNTYTFTITQNTTITVYFKSSLAQARATAGGEVRITGNDIGLNNTSATVTYTALAYNGYYLIGWYLDNTLYSSTANTITLTQSQAQGICVTAVFSTNQNETPNYTFNREETTTISSSIGGEARMVGYSGEYNETILIATVQKGYKFTGWYIDGTLYSTYENITLDTNNYKGKVIEARFELINNGNVNDDLNN